MGHDQSTASAASPEKSKSTFTSTLTISHSKGLPNLPRLSPVSSDVIKGSRFHQCTSSGFRAANESELVFSRLSSNKSSHHRRSSSLLLVDNGITNTFVSARICKIGARFWQKNIASLPMPDQLEIACSIWFSMLSSSAEMKKVMKGNLSGQKIEQTAIRYLQMMGWLIRHLVTDNIDLCALLSKLGAYHQNMGIRINHYEPMLQAIHETFSYYFDHDYTIEVKYAFDEIFTLAAQMMTGCSLKQSSHLLALSEQFQGDEIPFLKSLNVCLQSNIGKEYLYRYLQQTWCDEIVIFWKTLSRFKALPSDKERFMVARDIIKTCIEPSAEFSLNLCYENRANTLSAMQELEKSFATKTALTVPTTLFMAVEEEVCKLVMDNHFKNFVESIQILQLKSSALK